MAKKEEKKEKQGGGSEQKLANTAPAQKTQTDETKNSTGNAFPPDSAATTDTKAEADKSATDSTEKRTESQPDDTTSAVKANTETDKTSTKGSEKPTAIPPSTTKIETIAFEITLKAIHPQASYGRCGYRFVKDKAVEIPLGDLTGEQIITLSQDPWLECVPVCEEG